MKILLIDNYDSFTYNLYHYLSSLKCKVDVYRNDKITLKKIIKEKYKKMPQSDHLPSTYRDTKPNKMGQNYLKVAPFENPSGVATHTSILHQKSMF